MFEWELHEIRYQNPRQFWQTESELGISHCDWFQKEEVDQDQVLLQLAQSVGWLLEWKSSHFGIRSQWNLQKQSQDQWFIGIRRISRELLEYETFGSGDGQ